MYQINLSLNNENINWFYFIQDVLDIKIKKHGGVLATEKNNFRLNISLACELENKTNILLALNDSICDMFGSIVKLDYIKSLIDVKQLKQESLDILLYTLVAFDRETEKSIILDNIKLNDGMALDGIFNFTMVELKDRWKEIATLATDNARFLMDDETLNELLRFLLSAINPKVSKLEINENNNSYYVIAISDTSYEYKISSSKELLKYLIDSAPLEINLRGSFSDKALYKRLTKIFDAKNDEKIFTIQKQ